MTHFLEAGHCACDCDCENQNDDDGDDDNDLLLAAMVSAIVLAEARS